MYNFLDPILLPKVTTKCSAMDRYEVDNLISADYLVKSRGFIAYTTMKPPIEIDFKLICNASLSHIIVSSKLGSHKSSGVEILVKNANCGFVSICKAFYEENGVVFCNSRYYSKSKPPINNSGYHISYFKSNEFRAFINADIVKVRILKTDGTVPCLAAVEIWGNISKSCSFDTAKTVRRLVSKNKQTLQDPASEERNKIECKTFEIPDDFKDALTYDLMAVPLTLPSGHTIDQSTLEKCLATDASCGRHGCDPFTGLRYTDKRKPVLNVALKTRIDMFLLSNSHLPEMYSVKRTLGNNRNYKRSSSEQQFDETSDYSHISHVSKKIKLSCDNSDSSSLDDAIRNALNNKDFMRFTNSSSHNENEEVNKNVCINCSEQENLYLLPCKHLYCRTCLLNIESKFKCKNCDVEFLRGDLQKYHC